MSGLAAGCPRLARGSVEVGHALAAVRAGRLNYLSLTADGEDSLPVFNGSPGSLDYSTVNTVLAQPIQ